MSRRSARRRAQPCGCAAQLIALRRAELFDPSPVYTRLAGPPGTWIYRTGALTVMANFTDEPIALPKRLEDVVLATDELKEPVRSLPAWAGVVVRTG